jgi:hypothetical protein
LDVLSIFDALPIGGIGADQIFLKVVHAVAI